MLRKRLYHEDLHEVSHAFTAVNYFGVEKRNWFDIGHPDVMTGKAMNFEYAIIATRQEEIPILNEVVPCLNKVS